jgi:hypothetical protein
VDPAAVDVLDSSVENLHGVARPAAVNVAASSTVSNSAGACGFPAIAVPPRLDVSLRLGLIGGGFLGSREEEEESAGEGVPDGRGDVLEDAARQWPR